MTRARRAGLIVVLLGAASVLAAGNARGDRQAVSPAQTVTSKDGGLTVSVPRGALSRSIPIRVRTLMKSQYPPELRNATVRPGSKLDELEPSGLRFLKPVTITRRIDTRVAGFKKDTVQGVVLASRDRSGKWELLKSLNARLNGNTLVRQPGRHGTSRRCSRSTRASACHSLPVAVDASVGDKWVARVVSAIDNRRRRDAISVDSDETQWNASGVVGLGANVSYTRQEFVCNRVGTGTYIAMVTVAESSLAVFLGSLGGRYEETFPLVGRARCRAKAPTTTLELAAACVAVTHTPFGQFPSSCAGCCGSQARACRRTRPPS